MRILECRVVATTPPYIRLVSEEQEGGPPDTKAAEWRVKKYGRGGRLRKLTGWTLSGNGGPVNGGYAFTLRAGDGVDLGWLTPLAKVHVVPDFVGDEEGVDCVVEAPEDTGIRSGIEDLIGFPVITDTGGGGGGPAATSTQSVVDTEIRRVLGRKPPTDDVESTLALMDRRMRLTEDEGVQRWELVPGGASFVEADTGAGVTGRQASLAGLASDTWNQIQPLAETVDQLAPSTDNPGVLAAARANFLATAGEAVAQAGVPGGPLVLKANILLEQSLTQLRVFGENLGVLEADEKVEGRWSPTRRNVVTPADEEQFTAFLIVLERWRVFHDAFRDYLGNDQKAADIFAVAQRDDDFGLRFTLLDRTVDVIAEAVSELDLALRSVGIDHQEREAMRVGDGATIADVMDWAESFPEQEARPLIQQAGVKGVALLPPRLDALADVVKQLRAETNAPGAGHRALRHPRVRVAVDKLLRELRHAKDKAKEAAQV
jgi:hypothetical protein